MLKAVFLMLFKIQGLLLFVYDPPGHGDSVQHGPGELHHGHQPFHHYTRHHHLPKDGCRVLLGPPHEAHHHLRLGDQRRVQDRGSAGHPQPLHQVLQEARHPHELPFWDAPRRGRPRLQDLHLRHHQRHLGQLIGQGQRSGPHSVSLKVQPASRTHWYARRQLIFFLLLNIIFCRIRERVRCAVIQARLPRAHRAAARLHQHPQRPVPREHDGRGGAAQGLGSCGRDLLSQPRVQRQRHMFHRAKNARGGRISVKFEHKLTVRTSGSLNGCLVNRHTFTILRFNELLAIFPF